MLVLLIEAKMQEKFNYYVSSIKNSHANGDYDNVKLLWLKLSEERVDAPCGKEPNAKLILSVRDEVLNIVLESLKHIKE
jgi:hypothetical protein